MEIDDIVQIDSKGILDKSLHGCIGIVIKVDTDTASVSIFYPKEKGKNPFVNTFQIPNLYLKVVGKSLLKRK